MSMLNPSLLSFIEFFWNFVFQKWLLCLSIMSRVHSSPTSVFHSQCTLISHCRLFDYLRKLPRSTFSPVGEHLFHSAAPTFLNSHLSSLRNIAYFLKFKVHLQTHFFGQSFPNSEIFCVFFLFFMRSDFFGRFCAS